MAGNAMQLQTTEEEPGEAITDNATYYVSAPDATIRNSSNPATFTSNNITQGLKVKRTRTFSNGAVAQVEVTGVPTGSTVAVGTKYWTTFSNVTASSTVSESGNHYVTYNDAYIYGSPYGSVQTTTTGEETTNQSLAASNETAYTIVERCGIYAKVQQGGTDKGWIQEGALMNQTGRDRAQYLTTLKTWLEARYTEVEALSGDAQKTRIVGILSLMEDVAHQMESGTYPTVADLDTTPDFETHSYTSFVPSELTLTVRNFIVLLEAGEPAAETETDATATDATATTETETETEDGLDYDWNSRLGVPQYRTQSDNLAPPEATCGPTAFTMGLERLGYGRATIIQAIDDKLREDMEDDATQAQVEEKFEEKAEDFLESFSSASSNWQKLRGNQGGLTNDEDDLAEEFREWGQYEDLTYFLAWLNNISRGNVANSSSQTLLDAVHDADTGVDNAAGTNSTKLDFNNGQEFTMDHRKQIRDTLNAGGAAILSLYHKGTAGGTHITAIREVTSTGLKIDDPYGQVNPGYRQGVAGDAFKDVGGTAGRGSYNWKNVPHYDATENDYSERDFTRSAAEELEADESRGQNEIITWEMIRESTRLLYYIRLYDRR